MDSNPSIACQRRRNCDGREVRLRPGLSDVRSIGPSIWAPFRKAGKRLSLLRGCATVRWCCVPRADSNIDDEGPTETIPAQTYQRR